MAVYTKEFCTVPQLRCNSTPVGFFFFCLYYNCHLILAATCFIKLLNGKPQSIHIFKWMTRVVLNKPEMNGKISTKLFIAPVFRLLPVVTASRLATCKITKIEKKWSTTNGITAGVVVTAVVSHLRVCNQRKSLLFNNQNFGEIRRLCRWDTKYEVALTYTQYLKVSFYYQRVHLLKKLRELNQRICKIWFDGQFLNMSGML